MWQSFALVMLYAIDTHILYLVLFLLSLSTVVLNSRDRQGMYGMQHIRAPINKPHNSL